MTNCPHLSNKLPILFRPKSSGLVEEASFWGRLSLPLGSTKTEADKNPSASIRVWVWGVVQQQSKCIRETIWFDHASRVNSTELPHSRLTMKIFLVFFCNTFYFFKVPPIQMPLIIVSFWCGLFFTVGFEIYPGITYSFRFLILTCRHHFRNGNKRYLCPRVIQVQGRHFKLLGTIPVLFSCPSLYAWQCPEQIKFFLTLKRGEKRQMSKMLIFTASTYSQVSVTLWFSFTRILDDRVSNPG